MRASLLLAAASISLLVGSASPSWSQPSFTDRFDDSFRAAASDWWPAGPGWEWLKAQAVQESGLDPHAVSPVGASGILQFMSATWADERTFFKWGDAISASDAEPAIVAGAHYMARLDRIWAKNRTIAERHDLGLASYNAGAGSIIGAQTRCKAARLWADISPCLVWVTGRANAAQTVGYVRNIAKWRRMME